MCEGHIDDVSRAEAVREIMQKMYRPPIFSTPLSTHIPLCISLGLYAMFMIYLADACHMCGLRHHMTHMTLDTLLRAGEIKTCIFVDFSPKAGDTKGGVLDERGPPRTSSSGTCMYIQHMYLSHRSHGATIPGSTQSDMQVGREG